MTADTGRVVRVNGPVVEVVGLAAAGMFDLVEVGPARLPGEVTALRDSRCTVQVYGYAGGLRPGDPATGLGRPLSAWLGPGLLGGVFDGVLQPLRGRGAMLATGDRTDSAGGVWPFAPSARAGEWLEPGTCLGTVRESGSIEHRILVPPDVRGNVEWLAEAGDRGADEVVAVVGAREVRLRNPWPVRRPRPVRARVDAAAPLLTGQRVLDLLYPVARGSTAAVPGGFGTGKTVLLQQIARWCDADVIVYVGCGERGNEMADVLAELPAIEDPRTGRSLVERTVIVANTSNMPVMAREASIYSGITVAEYFRDMGLDSVVIADSTSRWAEAMREFASRTGQLPAEEGYPATLASAMAAFYERAGRVVTLGGADASVTIVGAVSPPGGDMTEPVTTQTQRFVRCLWSLDRDLAYARHYPAVSWRDSFSRDAAGLGPWYAERGDRAWSERRTRALAALADADRLESMAQLVGVSALAPRERVVVLTGRLLREAVLQQSSLSERDAHCAPAKQAALLDMVLGVGDRCLELVARGVAPPALEAHDFSALLRAREACPPDDAETPRRTLRAVLAELEGLR
ncbi:MAG TPA: V-type ATP synthase subunit A [Candidatus Dormibacteraeota bacterium]|nr:V-type ATP synthase subunit A [Candidatus Dormibacteraeota bacterium]